MRAPKLCVTVAASTTADLRRLRDDARDADLIELRLDGVRDLDVGAALADRTRPVIVTCRPKWEGGVFDGSESERYAILSEALARGAEYVDIEADAGFDGLIREHRGRRVILSMHDFSGVPGGLAERVSALRRRGAEIVKIAVMPRRLSDLVRLLDIERHDGTSELVLIAMGDAGLASRVLAGRFGSAWTYAGAGVAPGQIPSDRLCSEFRFREITDRTSVYGVVGTRVAHSLSPVMHNAAFRRMGIDAVYLPFVAADADDFLSIAKALDIRGASVTTPFKTDFYERAAEVDDISRRVGAVNTLRFDDGRLVAANTDVAGFLAPLRGRVLLDGARAAILGAGGAARAVAVALASAGARVAVHARRPERARVVADLVGGVSGSLPPPRGSWDILVNATSVGMFPGMEETPFPSAAFDGHLVYDLVYHPRQTRFLREAAAAGCETIGGLEMLVAQGERQLAWWTGIDPPAGILREAALARLGKATEETAS